jgi:hypothetical protein
MVKSFFFVLFLSLLFVNSISAQTISAKSSTDKNDYLIGDYIDFTVKIEYDPSISIVNPSIKDSLKNIDIIKSEAPVKKEESNKKVLVYKFILSRYDSAEVVIPPIPIYYRISKEGEALSPVISDNNIANDTTIKSTLTNEVRFTVHSLKISREEEIKDLKAPVKIPLDWKIIALWILAGLLLISAVIFLYLKWKKNKKVTEVEAPKIDIPPHVAALNSLNLLEKKKLWQQGLVKEFHTEITEIIRNYFEAAFNLHALELSTSELLEELSVNPEAKKIAGITSDFLNNADLVKFAKFQPINQVNEQMMIQAKIIVEDTIPAGKNLTGESGKHVQ